MKELDLSNEVVLWTTYHKIRIPYEYGGTTRMYVPDFLIVYKNGERVLEEVKGYINNLEMHDRKVIVAENWCKKNNCKYRLNFMEEYERNKGAV
jgi:hypothetical protein